MTVIIKEPNKKPVISNIDSNMDTLQKLVDGYIECIQFNSNVLTLINEEGFIKRLDSNIRYYDKILMGTIIFCSIKNDEFSSLSQKSINEIMIYLNSASLI